jgi:hypothetical protein
MASPQLVGYDLVAGDDDVIEISGPGGESVRVRANRTYALHLPLSVVLTGAGVVLQATPSKPFRPDRIAVATDVAGAESNITTRVGTIQAGNVTLTIGAQSLVHASLYDARAVGIRLRGETVAPGVACSVAVVNGNAATANISAAMFGLSNQ